MIDASFVIIIFFVFIVLKIILNTHARWHSHVGSKTSKEYLDPLTCDLMDSYYKSLKSKHILVLTARLQKAEQEIETLKDKLEFHVGILKEIMYGVRDDLILMKKEIEQLKDKNGTT